MCLKWFGLIGGKISEQVSLEAAHGFYAHLFLLYKMRITIPQDNWKGESAERSG